MSRLLAIAALAVTLVAQTEVAVVKITAGRADIRSGPSDSAPVVSQVTEGAYLILIKEDAAWFQVQLPARGGLRALGYLTKTSAVRLRGGEAAAALDALRRPPAKRPPGDSIVVGAELGKQTIWLKAQATQRFPIAEAITSVETAASAVSVTSVLGAAASGVDPSTVAVGPTVHEATWIWVTRVTPPGQSLSSRRPSFFVSYGEVPGLNSNEWAPYVVRLAPAGEWRVISALAGPALATNRFEVDWEVRRLIKQDEVASTITGLNVGMVRLTLKAPLAPGEYAIVIRPAFMRRAYAGRAILGDDGPGVAFGAAWVFTIR